MRLFGGARQFRFLLALVLSATAMLAPAPAYASHLPPPLIDSIALDGPAWASYRIEVPADADWSFGIFPIVRDASLASYLLWFREVSGHGGGYLAATAWDNDGAEVRVDAPPTGRMQVGGAPYNEDPEAFAPRYRMNGDGGGIYEVVVVAASDGVLSGAFRVGGSAGVKVLGRETGSEATVLSDRDFGGVTASAAVGIGDVPFVPTSGRVRATVGGSAQFDVTNRFFGWSSLGIGVARQQGPTGDGGDERVIRNGEPGHYEFTVDATAGDMPLWMLAADVRMPQ